MCLNFMSSNLNAPSKSLSIGPNSPQSPIIQGNLNELTKESEEDEIADPQKIKLKEEISSPNLKDENRQSTSNMKLRSVNLQTSEARKDDV